MRLKKWSTARHSNRAIRARLSLLAIERGLQPAELPKVIELDDTMLAFVRRHEVNLDWLFLGSLKGLWGMAYDALHPGSYAAGRD
ncbi:hypothetical protein [Bradyrhizobium erythrophlei]|uniref:Uncharacterized protein n=1 Tax=Bradyrhizobium erythrophlei TaxID=1437360 RepID=A0A1M7UVB4_9BRAD|nr:hypothetical protein [Bradyrhizobium erythrophlei]SHN86909.1 hypothetical protein SAMN05444170_6910 [Bradyrhizobium erythrophlei]